ncbi:MAG: L,D-transpeptidase family protein [Methylocystis sp.]|jgi:L,D-peptidoglycan transpeptidase YkuD (ErfK/YbiS/YcfS/YnhG family)
MKTLFPSKGRRAGVKRLLVSRAVGGPPHQGRLICGTLTLRCALGRSGVTSDKREGDGATPRGRLKLLYALLRPARFSRASFLPPARFLREKDIWCDDPRSFRYNRPLRGPSKLSHEELWRSDRLYDFIGVLDHNIRPARLGRGSAIFFHIATDDLGPTAGCVALRARDMARLLPRLARRAALEVK